MAKKVKDQNDEMKSCGLLAHGLTRRKLTMNLLSVFERMMLAKKHSVGLQISVILSILVATS